MEKQAYLNIKNIRYPQDFDKIEKIKHFTWNPIFEVEGLSKYQLTPFEDEVEIYGKDFYYYKGDEVICEHEWVLSDFVINSIINHTENYLWNGRDEVPEDVIFVEIEDGITRIDEMAFTGRDQMLSIIIPNTVKRIYDGAFANCRSLTSIILPDSVEYLGGWMFSGCISLKSIKLSDNLTALSRNMFEDCKSLIEITIPKSVEIIDKYVFLNCKALKKVKTKNHKLVSRLKDETPSLTDVIAI